MTLQVKTTIKYPEWVTPAEQEAENRAWLDALNQAWPNVTELDVRFRATMFGRFLCSKEVGPPPWRWPKIGVWPKRRSVHIQVGWRSTAYRLIWVAKKGSIK